MRSEAYVSQSTHFVRTMVAVSVFQGPFVRCLAFPCDDEQALAIQVLESIEATSIVDVIYDGDNPRIYMHSVPKWGIGIGVDVGGGRFLDLFSLIWK